MQYNLTAAGITNLGTIHANTGLGRCPSSYTGADGRLEVFVNDVAQVLARYPNINSTSGLWQWENIDKVRAAAVSPYRFAQGPLSAPCVCCFLLLTLRLSLPPPPSPFFSGITGEERQLELHLFDRPAQQLG